MVGAVRGVSTLLGIAAAGFCLWLSTHMGDGVAGYWARLGLIAAAGLVLVLFQVFGGWTKWGLPQLSGNVFVLGFLPALAVAGWVLISGQPDDNWFQRHVVEWSGDLHVSRLVRHLRDGYLGVLAFGLGNVLGFTVDTRGPRALTSPPQEPLPTSAREEPPVPPATDAPTALAARLDDEEAAPEPETTVLSPEPPGPEDETRVAPRPPSAG